MADSRTKIIHIIDPNADMEIVLRNEAFEFAPWHAPQYTENKTRKRGDENLSPERSIDGSKRLRRIDNHMAEGSIEAQNLPDTNTFTSSQTFGAEQCSNKRQYHYMVSSRQLALASPLFNSMLSGERWKEGIRDPSSGLYHMYTEEWDSRALLIFLRAVHNCNMNIPDKLPLEMLAKIAVLVDYYDCRVALKFHITNWCNNLRGASYPPSEFCRVSFLWLCVALVFKIPSRFSLAAHVIVRHCPVDIPTLDLPITRCTEKMDVRRICIIKTIFTGLKDLLEEYSSPDYKCPNGYSSECGPILYKALEKQMEEAGFSPPPVSPFHGLSIDTLNFKVQYFGYPSRQHSNTGDLRCRCNLSLKIQPVRCGILESIRELKMKDFE